MKKIKIRKKPLFNFLIEANHDDLQLCAPVPAFPAFSCRWERMCLASSSVEDGKSSEYLGGSAGTPCSLSPRLRSEGIASDTGDGVLVLECWLYHHE